MANTWQVPTRMLLRNRINDAVSPYTYSDSRLNDILIAAAAEVCVAVNFANDYIVNITQQTITPDPGTDNMFMVLVALKAATFVTKSEYHTASLKAYNFKDGPSSIDGRSVAEAKKVIAANAQKEYDDAVFAYQVGNYSVGEAIVSPFRIQYSESYSSRG